MLSPESVCFRTEASPWKTFVLGTIKRGTLSKNRKNCLDLVNNETKIQPQANPPPHPRPGWTARPTLNKYPGSPEAGSAQNHTTRPRTRYRFSDSPEAPRQEASDEPPILRLIRGPAPQGLGRATQLPTRSRPARHQPRHLCLDRLL